ncbi:MAG: TolC family protein, partial [Muribaculaceae bacterium]|nr:TolC family protein [Muribaculaceae bacterium]
MKTIIADSIRFFIVMAVMASVSQTLRSQSAASRILSLEEMFSLADERSKAIKVYESAIDVANKNIDVAKNAYLPHINVTASATYNGNAWVANRDFSNGQFFPSPHFGNSYAIEASQVVFAGGAILGNIKVMEIQKRIAEWNLKAK